MKKILMVLLSSLVLTACNSGGGNSGGSGSGTVNLAGTYSEAPTLITGDISCPKGSQLNNIVINSNNQYCGIDGAYCYQNPINMLTPTQCFSGSRIEDSLSWDTTFNNCSVSNNGVFSFIESLQFSDDNKKTFTTCTYSVVMTKK